MKKSLFLMMAALTFSPLFSCSSNLSSQTSSVSDSSTIDTGATEGSSQSGSNETQDSDDYVANNSDEIVVYFSATSRTESVANTLQGLRECDIFEIVPSDPYTEEDLNYNDDSCRANQEQDDDTSRPEISTTLDNIEDYNVIYLGFPIWWGTIPRIIYTFMDSYNLDNKTIAPFCTSGSSGISTAVRAITNYEPNATVTQGLRTTPSSAESDLTSWLATIGLSD